jgi:hypothetical protein
MGLTRGGRAARRPGPHSLDSPPSLPLQLRNPRNQLLVCSHYIPCEPWKTEKQLPAVIYLHGNAGCRVDANVVAFALLRRGITCVPALRAGGGSHGALARAGGALLSTLRLRAPGALVELS